MTPDQRKLARHALGLDNPDAKGQSYRNRYYASVGHPAWDNWHAMVGAGSANADDQSTTTLFSLTRAGAIAALDPGETLDPEDFPA